MSCINADMRNTVQPRTAFGGRSGSETPVLTYTLIGLNVVMFVLQNVSRGLQNMLVLWAPAVAGGEFYRLVTSAFMHYGIVHVLFNMWALFIIGPPLESWLGRSRFGALYALSALGGSVLVYVAAPLNTATAGASGAIFGLFGATFVVARRLKFDVRWVVILIAINLVLTFSVASISWQGHVGGLVTGALLAAAYVYAPRAWRNLVQVGVTAGVSVIFVVLILWRTAELLDHFGVLR